MPLHAQDTQKRKNQSLLVFYRAPIGRNDFQGCRFGNAFGQIGIQRSPARKKDRTPRLSARRHFFLRLPANKRHLLGNMRNQCMEDIFHRPVCIGFRQWQEHAFEPFEPQRLRRLLAVVRQRVQGSGQIRQQVSPACGLPVLVERHACLAGISIANTTPK